MKLGLAKTSVETISNAEVFSGLRPHILGLISIFNGKPLKIEEKIMFCCSQTVMYNTSGNGDIRYIDILKIFACKMSAAVCKTFSYIFICEANKNIDQAKDVRASARETFGV